VTASTAEFSRVTVVAPRTRIDVALPADVAVADLLPVLVEMARQRSPDDGGGPGGWCLARMSGDPLDPGGTLAAAGVLDGTVLQLRRRAGLPPPPLFDDAVEAVAVAEPASYRPWTPRIARAVGQAGGGSALALAPVALVQPGTGLPAAVTAGGATVLAVLLGGVTARVFGDGGCGVLIAAAAGLPAAFVAGLDTVPGGPGRPDLLLACVFVLVAAAAAVLVLGAGVTVFAAAAAAATFGAGAALAATLVARPAAGIAAGAVAAALAALPLLPRLAVQLTRLPLPALPCPTPELETATGCPDFAEVERRTGLAHELLTGLILGCGLVVAGCATVLAWSGRAPAILLAVTATLVLLLRARAHANGIQAVAVLATGALSAAGMVAAWLRGGHSPHTGLAIFATLSLLGTVSLVLGAVVPNQRYPPTLRRCVDIVEAALITAVLPVALAVMEVYATARHLDLGS
jgi:type VII secretion integral membrane protein EccD